MIFLSHNYKDKSIVEQFALNLKNVYGQDRVFYDSWSIQPGDGIIDKMNEGLHNCRYFIFFISQNSLSSEMVKLEWQNALYKVAKERIVFIPVRLDKSIMPAILTQTLYIDLFSQGLDVALRQVIDVIDGNNTYRGPQREYSNLTAYKYKENDRLVVECHAEHYFEPISSFMFCTNHDSNDIYAKVRGEASYWSSNKNGGMLGNIKVNYVELGISKGTVPGFPFVVELSSRSGMAFDIDYVLHEKRKGDFFPIPIVKGRKS